MANAHAMEVEVRDAPAEEAAQVPAAALVEFVQKRPWTAVLGAAFAGYALARLVRGLR